MGATQRAGLGVWNFLFVLLVPVLLYLVSSLIFPESSDDWDLRTYYYAQARKIHGLLASAIAVNALSQYALLGRTEIQTLAIMRVGMVVALCLCAIWNRNQVLHRIVVPLLLLAGAAMPAVLNLEIAGGAPWLTTCNCS